MARMADSEKEGRGRSGGQRIDDHSFWAGRPGKDDVFPDGPHKVKTESSAEGAGEVMKYEDTTSMIREQQTNGDKKIKQHPLKSTYRN